MEKIILSLVVLNCLTNIFFSTVIILKENDTIRTIKRIVFEVIDCFEDCIEQKGSRHD